MLVAFIIMHYDVASMKPAAIPGGGSGCHVPEVTQEKALPQRCTKLYRVVLHCTELYCIVQSCTALYRDVQRCAEFSVPSCTELHQVVQSCTANYKVIHFSWSANQQYILESRNFSLRMQDMCYLRNISST